MHTLGVPRLNRNNQRKSNSLTYVNGYPVTRPQAPIGGGPRLTGVGQVNDDDLKALASATKNMYETTAQGTNRVATQGSVPPTFVPAFVAYDKLVLRFGAYFKESVVESREENYRMRVVDIVCYLEDDSIAVIEKAQENSGIPQGQLVKRHRIPNPDRPGDFFNAGDLRVGANVTIYGKTFHIANCDSFTRNYCDEQGDPQPSNEVIPEDPYLKARKAAVNAKGAPTKVKPAMDHYAQFLKYDGEVLVFYALWDDSDSLYGEQRKFMLRYFLADDTVEVNEIYKPNCGYDPYPKFFRRGRLHRTSKLPQPGEEPAFISDADLRVGQTVPVAGRNFFLYDCNDRTREYYRAKYGVEMEAVEIEEVDNDAPPAAEVVIPQHTGFGSQEDSLGSVHALVPKPPRKDIVKLVKNEGKMLRFSARLDTTHPADAERRFIVSFHLMDDTLQIFEPPRRNSGMVAGKFLERGKVNGPDGLPIRACDLFVGGVLEVLAQRFILLDADEFTLRYMEDHDAEFPMSSVAEVRARIIADLGGLGPGMAERVSGAFARYDSDGNGWLSVAEFRRALRELGMQSLTEQEVLTIMRHYDTDGDGRISYGEFAAALMNPGYDEHTGDATEAAMQPTAQERLALDKIMDTIRDKIHNRKPAIRDTFRDFDTNKDSFIDVEEFKVGLDKIGVTLDERMLEFVLEKFFYDEEENLWQPKIDYTDFVESLWEKNKLQRM